MAAAILQWAGSLSGTAKDNAAYASGIQVGPGADAC